MVYKKTIGRYIFEFINIVIMLAVAFACLAPILHVFFASISDPTKLSGHEGIILHPLGKATLKGYLLVFRNPNITIGYLNTIFYVVVGTVISMLLTIFGGYAFSRKNFLLRNHLMLFVSFTMLFNGGLIPTFMVVKALGLYDSRWAIIIPSAISVFNLVIMRTSFLQIPDSIEESAKLDGANDFTILFRIILPVSKPILATIAIFAAVYQWNSFQDVLIYVSRESLQPLQFVLYKYINQANALAMLIRNSTGLSGDALRALTTRQTPTSVRMTVSVIVVFPILLVYPLFQRHFVKGIMIGSVKG